MSDDRPTPTELVDEQTAAYNDGDLEAFVDCFAEDAVVARLAEGDLVAESRAELGEQYGGLFEAAADVHCEVVETFAVDGFVARHERVTGVPEPFDALAVYRVEEGAITRLWLAEG